VGSALAHLELAFLCVLALCIALIPALPVPRVWALPGALLVGVETAAVRDMRLEPFEPAVHHGFEPLDTVAEVVALVVVPVLTAGLLVVVCWHLARANARVRRSLAADAERAGA
jgi:hypothetical protein